MGEIKKEALLYVGMGSHKALENRRIATLAAEQAAVKAMIDQREAMEAITVWDFGDFGYNYWPSMVNEWFIHIIFRNGY